MRLGPAVLAVAAATAIITGLGDAAPSVGAAVTFNVSAAGAVSGPPGSTSTLITESVPSNLVGQSCAAVAIAGAGASSNDGNDLILSSSNTVTFSDVEHPGTTTPGSGKIELSTTVTVSVRLGSAGLYSGNDMSITIDCPGPDTTSTTTSTPATSAPATTTTSTTTTSLPAAVTTPLPSTGTSIGGGVVTTRPPLLTLPTTQVATTLAPVESTAPNPVPAETTSTSISPSPSSEELARRLAECEGKADQAIVELPESLVMTVDVPTVVTVVARLPEDSTPSSSVPDEGAPATTTVENVDLACFVVATLTSPQFDIEDEEQTGDFLENTRIDWSWSVTAREPGNDLQIVLTITPRIDIGNGVREFGSPKGPFVALIDVNAQPRSAWVRATDGLASVVNHPLFRGFVPAVTIAGLLAGFWKWVLHRPWPWTDTAAGSEAGEPEGPQADD